MISYHIRIGRYTLEKATLEKCNSDLGLAIPAHILSFYGNSLRTFLRLTGKKFFIDPITYVFVYGSRSMKKEVEEEIGGVPVTKEVFKKSYEKLLENFDPSLRAQILAGKLSPSFFDNRNNLRDFVNSNLEYQQDFFIKKPYVMTKYEKMLKIRVRETHLRPEFFVVPYFYFGTTSDQWYEVCKSIADYSKKVKSNLKKFFILCFDKSLLASKSSISNMVEDFAGFDGYGILVSDFNEIQVDLHDLRRLKRFVSDLSREYQKPIINLYGTYFSALLSYFGLNGFSSGLCINDSKNATKAYVTGRMNLRLYLPSLHWFIPEADMKTYFVDHHFIDECKCPFCVEMYRMLGHLEHKTAKIKVVETILRDRKFVINGCFEHFLFQRTKEIEFVSTHDRDTVAKGLEEDIERCKSEMYPIKFHSIKHLNQWREVIAT